VRTSESRHWRFANDSALVVNAIARGTGVIVITCQFREPVRTVHMRRSLRAFWGTLMLASFVAAAIDPARSQGVAASPVAPAPSQVTPPALPAMPQAFPEAPPFPKCRNTTLKRSFKRPRRCRS